MFRKLVSNLAFSPALVGQLGFYAKRLRKEETTRRVGLIFTALTLVVQFFAVFQPPQSANASSSSDMIPGGFSTLAEYLRDYDTNAHNLRDFYNAMGVTREELANAKYAQLHSFDPGLISWGRQPKFSAAQGEKAYSIPTDGGGSASFYARPLRLWSDGPNYMYTAYVGYSQKVGWFALLRVCGNFVTKTYPVIQTCPEGTLGVYPNCKKKTCPPGTIGTYPDCKQPPTPAASCTALSITKVNDSYTLTGRSLVSGGATVSGYTYTVKKDGTTVHTKTNSTTNAVDTTTYTQKTPGTYTVTLTVATSQGQQTSAACAGTFTVPKPAMCQYNPSLPANSPECQPCPGNDTLWIKDAKCEEEIIKTKSADNITQGGADATSVVADASNKISYRVTLKNIGQKTATAKFSDNISDVLEYASVVDAGGATVDENAKTITWADVTLKPGQEQSRVYVVQLAQQIPAMPKGQSDPTSYDCVMTNTFGNSLNVKVNCPTPKIVEQTVAQLPHTGAGTNMMAAGSVLAVVVYFYARSRQMKKEVRLIRRDLNAGTI